jgi:hypothetical protein
MWTRLVNVTSKREGNVEVYVSLIGPDINGLTVLSAEPRELTVVNIIGPVDLEKLAKLEGTSVFQNLGIKSPKKPKDEQ